MRASGGRRGRAGDGSVGVECICERTIFERFDGGWQVVGITRIRVDPAGRSVLAELVDHRRFQRFCRCTPLEKFLEISIRYCYSWFVVDVETQVHIRYFLDIVLHHRNYPVEHPPMRRLHVWANLGFPRTYGQLSDFVPRINKSIFCALSDFGRLDRPEQSQIVHEVIEVIDD